MLHQDRQDLAVANRTVRHGHNLDVVGDRGSGRTTLLQRLSTSLMNSGWTVRTISGIASFKGSPLTALALAGCAAPREIRPATSAATIAMTVDELAGQLPTGTSAILVDDWDDLDEASWGVICALHRLHGVPVVTSRLPAGRGRAHPSGLRSTSFSDAHELRLRPLHFEELGRILHAHLENPIAEDTLSRIYAKTGGNLGLSRALVDAAVQDGRLDLVDQQWIATGDLWTDTLGAVVRTLLAPLDEAQRDLLEVLSVVGTVDLATLGRLTDLAALEQLEADDFIALYPSGNRMLVTVAPPLLVEYFRHEAPLARRFRLAATVTAQLGDDSQTMALSNTAPRDESRNAQLVRLVHEQLRNQHLIAMHAWRSHPTLATASAAVQATALAGRPVHEIDAIISDVRPIHGTEEELVDWALVRAEVALAQREDPQLALSILEEATLASPHLAQIPVARAAEITLLYVPGAPTPELPDYRNPALNPRAQRALQRAHAMRALVAGQIGESWACFTALGEITPPQKSYNLPADIFGGYAEYLSGETASAIERGHAAFEEATSQLDLAGIRGYGSLIATLLLFEGRHREAGTVLERVFMLGSPVTSPPFVHLTLLIAASVLASRRGLRDAAEQRLQEAERLVINDAPIPGGSRDWARMQILASAGERIQAADFAVQSGDDSWEAGARSVAAYAYLGALEIDPTPDRFAKVAGRLSKLDSHLIEDLTEYTSARVSDDASALLASAERAVCGERFAHALSALDRAAQVLRDADRIPESEEVEARRSRLVGTLSEGQYDTRRGGHTIVELTKREAQVARLASSGLSNQQIADDLVLSVRTVESHLHRLMRKLGVERRTELSEHLARDQEAA